MGKNQNQPGRSTAHMRFATVEAYYESCGVSIKAAGAVPQGKRTWLYGRIATELSAMSALGKQHGQTARRAEEMGYGVVGFSEDRGAGRDLNRPGLNEMRRAAKEHRFDILFVHGASRLSRDTLLASELMRELKDQGIKVYAVKEAVWLTEDPLLDMIMDAHWAPSEAECSLTQNL